MGVAHIGLVHRDPCECKVKGFHAIFSIERNVSKGGTCRGCNKMCKSSKVELHPFKSFSGHHVQTLTFFHVKHVHISFLDN